MLHPASLPCQPAVVGRRPQLNVMPIGLQTSGGACHSAGIRLQPELSSVGPCCQGSLLQTDITARCIIPGDGWLAHWNAGRGRRALMISWRASRLLGQAATPGDKPGELMVPERYLVFGLADTWRTCCAGNSSSTATP